MKELKVKTDGNGRRYTSYEEVERKQKPLSVSEILTISECYTDRLFFARAIERAHGIGEDE